MAMSPEDQYLALESLLTKGTLNVPAAAAFMYEKGARVEGDTVYLPVDDYTSYRVRI